MTRASYRVVSRGAVPNHRRSFHSAAPVEYRNAIFFLPGRIYWPCRDKAVVAYSHISQEKLPLFPSQIHPLSGTLPYHCGTLRVSAMKSGMSLDFSVADLLQSDGVSRVRPRFRGTLYHYLLRVSCSVIVSCTQLISKYILIF